MIPKQIFTYWEGMSFDYIKYCFKTIEERSECKLFKLNPTNIDEYIDGSGLSRRWKCLKIISQKVDCLRAALLYNNGGMWCDADTVWLHKIPEELFQNDHDICLLKWPSGIILNGYFIAKKNSVFLQKVIERINTYLSDGRTKYPENGFVLFGETVFNEVAQQYPDLVNILPTDIFLPVEFQFNPRIWEVKKKINEFIKPETLCIGLSHSTNFIYSRKSVYQAVSILANQDNLFGDIFKHSINLGEVNS